MIRAALLALALSGFSGCAGTAHYSVEPFYDESSGRLICCRADAFSGKDVDSLTFDLSMTPGNEVTVHFSETGVGATQPIAAQSQATSAVAGAISNAAGAVIKLAP